MVQNTQITFEQKAHVVQSAETGDLKSPQCQFESDRGYHYGVYNVLYNN